MFFVALRGKEVLIVVLRGKKVFFAPLRVTSRIDVFCLSQH